MDFIQESDQHNRRMDSVVEAFWEGLLVAAQHAVESHNQRETVYIASFVPPQYKDTMHVIRDWKGRSGTFDTRTSVIILLDRAKRSISARYQDNEREVLDFVWDADKKQAYLLNGQQQLGLEAASEFFLRRVLLPA